jgi:hypothetical protein
VQGKANAKTPNRLKKERLTKGVKKGITLKSTCHSKRFITYLVPLPVYSGFVRWICISCPSRRSKSV